VENLNIRSSPFKITWAVSEPNQNLMTAAHLFVVKINNQKPSFLALWKSLVCLFTTLQLSPLQQTFQIEYKAAGEKMINSYLDLYKC